MKAKIAAILLAAVLLISALAACSGSDGSSGAETATTGADTAEAEAAETTTARLTADVPDSDFNGYEFTFLARGKKNNWENYEFEIDQLDGDVINDALYERNSKISDELNITFKHERVDGYDVNTPFTKAVLSGEDIYDVALPSITDAGKYAQSGYLVPLQDLKYMDLEKPWYDARCIEELKINGKNYLFFSDITVRNLDAIWIYCFNKQYIEDFNLDEPYDLMAAGTWTMDNMTAMCKAVMSDVNGDGLMDKSDRWGLVAHDYVITAGYIGSGERIATAAKDGSISLTMNNQRIYEVIDSLIGLQDYWIRYSLTAKKYSTAAPVGFEPSDNYAELIGVFKAGSALFCGEVLAVMSDMRDSDIDFGVVPTPKLNEKQDDYYSAVNYIAAAMVIPLTATDLDRTSIVIESLAAESHYTVIPAYYEIAMKSKYARDLITSDMLDLIFDSRSYDLGIYYGWGDLSARFCSLVYEASTDFASMYDANKSAAEEALNKFVEQFS